MIARTPHLTQGFSDVLEHQIRTTYPGQAHFANRGPFVRPAATLFLGYHRQIRNKSGDTVKTVHRGGCKKFTGNHGPRVPASVAACRYFERKGE